jgi:C4-dicarboxylate-specific signal transduction histidine kinase/ActR/RegA family two-component response regulator
MDATPEEFSSGSWRRGWASVGAVVATILLIALVVMVTISNSERDRALQWERRTRDVIMLTQAVDATIARSEAALGRYVVDERRETANVYYNDWRLAGWQIERLRQMVVADPLQLSNVAELRDLYDKRGEELTVAARATSEKKAAYGLGYYYQVGMSPTLPALRRQLDAIAERERETLNHRMADTQMFAKEADQLTEWLGWVGVLIGIGAITLGLVAYQAISERLVARKDAENEAVRAQALEQAVEERTHELKEANKMLRAEAAERAAAEEQLRQVQKMEAVGQLTGGIAHDFNNMLAVVVGGLDLAKRRLHGPRREVEFHLDNAMEGANRAAALTRRLLAFARSEPLMPEGVAPAELVQGMLELVDRSIGERISVETRFPDEPWHVWVDSHQLENSILNLAVNARDAMDGQGQLAIAIDNVSLKEGEVGVLHAGDYVCLSMSDTGSGIPPENIDRVFEPFFTTKPVGKGTGLGLSQIFAFARQSGGEVTIQSAVDVGTTVSLYLPRSLQAAKDHAARAAAAQASTHIAEEDAVGTGASILVVEDDPRVSRSTVAALEELGYRPFACGSGKEAMDILAAQGAFELIITDVMMPEMTGPELVRLVAPQHPTMGVIFVTGYVGDAGDAEELSGHDMLRKPFTVTALAQAVARTLARKVSGLPPEPTSEAAE